MMKLGIALALGALTAPMAMAADAIPPERRALFIEIMSNHDCRFHNQTPSEALVEELFAADFDKAEIRAIGTDIMEKGEGEISAGALLVTVGPCAS